jgi:hypothetical protein
MNNHYKALLKYLFLDKELLFSVLAIVLIYPFLFIVQFGKPIEIKFIPLLIFIAYFGCVILSIPFKIIINSK